MKKKHNILFLKSQLQLTQQEDELHMSIDIGDLSPGKEEIKVQDLMIKVNECENELE